MGMEFMFKDRDRRGMHLFFTECGVYKVEKVDDVVEANNGPGYQYLRLHINGNLVHDERYQSKEDRDDAFNFLLEQIEEAY